MVSDRSLEEIPNMARHKRSVWEEMLEVGRRILKELDDFLDPTAQQPRKPARVPVPVQERSKGQRNE